MSDATRAVALTQAVHVVGSEGGQAVLDLAAKFDAFLLGSDAPAKVSTPGKEPGKPAGTSKPAAGGKKPTKTEDDLAREAAATTKDEEAEGTEGGEGGEAEAGEQYPATKEGVQAVIAKLLQANKRKEAIALLKKFNAASATGVKTKDAAKFIAEALKVVAPAAAEGDDLTA